GIQRTLLAGFMGEAQFGLAEIPAALVRNCPVAAGIVGERARVRLGDDLASLADQVFGPYGFAQRLDAAELFISRLQADFLLVGRRQRQLGRDGLVAAARAAGPYRIF